MNLENNNYENGLPAENNDPQKLRIIQERNEALLKAVHKLPSDFQDVIILHYFAELNVKEISEKLDKPEGTVKTNLSRAREKLKGYLSKSFKNNHLLYAEIMILLIALNLIIN